MLVLFSLVISVMFSVSFSDDSDRASHTLSTTVSLECVGSSHCGVSLPKKKSSPSSSSISAVFTGSRMMSCCSRCCLLFSFASIGWRGILKLLCV